MEVRAPARPRLVLAVLIAVLCGFLAGASFVTGAFAATPPSQADDFSAADQYVESVPTAGGPKVPGVGKSRDTGRQTTTTTKLNPTVKQSLDRQPAETAVQLERIATSPDYGAPTEKLHKVDARAAHVPAAAVSAADGGDDDTLTLLLIALLATTVLTVGTAAYRRYQSRKPAH